MNTLRKNIITIQSQVAGGYVGNSIATLAIQLHLFNAVQVPTVILSNHVEYSQSYGKTVEKELFADLLKGIKENGFAAQSSYVISGFCDSKDNISILAKFIADSSREHGLRYVYDPVFGDHRHGGLYIPDDLALYSIQKLLPLCEIVTPNHFELEYLLSMSVRIFEDLVNAVNEHVVLKDKTVIATGIQFADTLPNTIEVLLFTKGTVHRFSTPKLPIDIVGAGDLFTAILVSQLQLHGEVFEATKRATDYLNAVILATILKGYKDLNAESMLYNAHLLFDDQDLK